MMYKVEAIIREDSMEVVIDALKDLHVLGMTVSQVMGCGVSYGYIQKVRAATVDVNMIPKVKIEVVVTSQEWVDKTVGCISKVAQTGEPGDGKIFIYEISDVVRISTGERGPVALWDDEQKAKHAQEEEAEASSAE